MPEDWNRHEIQAIVDAYFWMLGDHVAGRAFVKRDVVRGLRYGALAARSESAISRKLGNISAIMGLIGAPMLPGYRPLEHFQSALKEQVTLVAMKRGLLPPGVTSSRRRSRKP